MSNLDFKDFVSRYVKDRSYLSSANSRKRFPKGITKMILLDKIEFIKNAINSGLSLSFIYNILIHQYHLDEVKDISFETFRTNVRNLIKDDNFQKVAAALSSASTDNVVKDQGKKKTISDKNNLEISKNIVSPTTEQAIDFSDIQDNVVQFTDPRDKWKPCPIGNLVKLTDTTKGNPYLNFRQGSPDWLLYDDKTGIIYDSQFLVPLLRPTYYGVEYFPMAHAKAYYRHANKTDLLLLTTGVKSVDLLNEYSKAWRGGRGELISNVKYFQRLGDDIQVYLKEGFNYGNKA